MKIRIPIVIDAGPIKQSDLLKASRSTLLTEGEVRSAAKRYTDEEIMGFQKVLDSRTRRRMKRTRLRMDNIGIKEDRR